MLIRLDLMEQRHKAVLEVLAGHPVIQVALRYGVARQTLQRWLRRYARSGIGGLFDKPTAPLTCPHQMSPEVEARLVKMRTEHPGWVPPPSSISSRRPGWIRSPGARPSIACCSGTASSHTRPADESPRTTGAGNAPVLWSSGRWTSWVG